MKRSFKLLTSLSTIATLSSLAIGLTSCSKSNNREIEISEAFRDMLDISSVAYSDNGDCVITLSPKDIHDYIPSIKAVHIADQALEPNQEFVFDANTNKLTIKKEVLDKYSGKIYIFPEDVCFKPIEHDYTSGKFNPTITQKSGIECNRPDFSDTYLADVYNDYSIFEQDWLNNQNERLDYWQSLDEYSSSIDYLKINKIESNNATTYTMDVFIHNSISGTSYVSDLGTTSGNWYFYGQNIALTTLTGGAGNWKIIPSTPNDDWSMDLIMSGFNQPEYVYEHIDKDSDPADVTEFYVNYFSFGDVSSALGLNSLLSYYFNNIDTVTVSSKVTSQSVENYSLEVPSTITNKDKSLLCKITPTDKETLYAPKLVITDANSGLLYQWASDTPIKGDTTYSFDLSERPISQDVKVTLTLNKYVPIDYSSVTSQGWNKTDTCPDYVVINNDKIKCNFNVKCDDSLKDKLYLINWQLNDQDDQKVYPGESKVEIAKKEPAQVTSQDMTIEYGLDSQKISTYTSFKLTLNTITDEPYAKVNYSSLPDGWLWGKNCNSYIYENTVSGWSLDNLYLVAPDKDYEEWYKVTITVKKEDEVIFSQTIDKKSNETNTASFDLSGVFDSKDISISAEFDKQVTYSVNRNTPPRKWHWLTINSSRIYNKDGKWVITRDLYLTLSSAIMAENEYEVKYIITNSNKEVIAEKTYIKEAESSFLGAVEISGDWGQQGPGNLTVSLEITKK